MKSAVFKPLDPISVLSALNNFEAACDRIEISEEDDIWLFRLFKKELTKVLSIEPHQRSRGQKTHQEEKLKTFCQIVNYLLET